jgi:heat shock protein HslJ
MQIRHLLTTVLFTIALMLGVVACAPAADTPTDTPPADSGGTGDIGGTDDSGDMDDNGGMDDAEPNNETEIDDSNGMEMNNDLIGNWQATDITGEPVAGNVIPSLSFGTNGEVAGNGGCNGYGGTYTVDGMNLSIVGVVSTMMACEDQTLMTQETNFLSSLQLATNYTLEGDTLTLLDGDGNAIVTLTRV